MTDSEPNEEGDIRPIVASRNASNVGLYAFLGILLVGGAGLFAALSANRASIEAPSTTIAEPDNSRQIRSPPPLAVPEEFLGPRTEQVRARPIVEAPVILQREVPRAARATTAPTIAPTPAQAPARYEGAEPIPVFPEPGREAVVFESGRNELPANGGPDGADSESERVLADRFARPSLTIPKGTVIPAVLETALDSTRPGAVRALVQLDVRGFDGTRILIGRGSRLYGEYKSGIEAGQNRALVRWTRLIRPDGVTIALDSPASDPLGRAGIKGKVDSKFFQRFGGALLQSVLDVGVGVATREATGGVVVALPGSTQNVSGRQPSQVQPTLDVKHGTSVSVFVARDLDFSSVDS